MTNKETITLSITSNPKSLPVVRSAAEKMARLEQFGERAIHELVLAVDEALANVIKHGYKGANDQPIHIEMSPVTRNDGRKGIAISVRDKGKQVDPTTIQGRDLDEIRPGGLGVHIIRAVMDEVEYSCPAEGGMMLRMVKYPDSAATSADSQAASSGQEC